MTISRRQLAKGAVATLPLALWHRLALANGNRAWLESEPEPHFLLFVQIYGAWDVCLAFDPKDRNLLLPNGDRQFDQPYEMSDVRDFGNGVLMAPAGHVLAPYADRLAIVNGIDMEVDGGHTPDIMMTGSQTGRASGSPYVQAMIAKRHPFLKRRAVPHLYTSYDGQFLSGAYQSSSIAASPADFLSVIGSGPAENPDTATLRGLMAEYQGQIGSPASRRTFGAYVNAADGALAVTKALKDYGFQAPADITVPAGVGSFVGQMFASGVVGAATLSIGSQYAFDTHSNHYNDHPLGRALTDIEGVIKALGDVRLSDQESVLQRTTVVITAEYARTPRLNAFQGKDHNFRTNSMVLLGHKVRPGVYGQSGVRQEGTTYEAHSALPIDYTTGRHDPAGKLMFARNLWAGLGPIVGVDIAGEFPAGTEPVRFFG